MLYKSILHKISAAIFIATAFFYLPAQNINCEVTAGFASRAEQKIATINTEDPEIITLHYLFVSDLLDSVNYFQEQVLPNLHFCPAIDFFATMHQWNALEERLLQLKNTLTRQKGRVDTLFYHQAEEALHFSDTTQTEYYLDRALQFNRSYTEALMLKLNLFYAEKKYDECIDILHIIYNETTLNRAQENALSDFNTAFYAQIYTLGDSLVKAGHQADALPLFETLENFCHDMPTAYCNDDYYHGIIRSKSGVYESYLVISKVAWERGNIELAYKFLDYAKAYRLENEEEVLISEQYIEYIEKMEAQRGRYHFNH